MARRSKAELEKMKDIVTKYLDKTNGPHEAWNLYIKDHLVKGMSLPTYVNGIKDFIKIHETRSVSNEETGFPLECKS